MLNHPIRRSASLPEEERARLFKRLSQIRIACPRPLSARRGAICAGLTVRGHLIMMRTNHHTIVPILSIGILVER
jgi:hypothetical protein